MTRRFAAFVLLLTLAASLQAAGPILGTEWTADLAKSGMGQPVALPRSDAAESVLVTLQDRLVLLDRTGRPVVEMKLDHGAGAEAVGGRLWKDGRVGIVALDIWGSVYCFDMAGHRLWKYARESNAQSYRLPVLADLDGDGVPEILVTDSRGYLIVLDTNGRLRMELQATRYRLSPPSVGDVDGDGKPEILFGTEDQEVICVDNTGRVRWTRRLEGRFGRSMPLVADAAGDGHYQVFMPSAFVQFKPGLWALDARTGAIEWKAESRLQTYQSTVMADLDGDGKNEIVFGDKNTRLYCVDAHGKQRWTTQLGGRGIFFAPVVVDLDGSGKSTIFQIVREAGEEGHALYALDPSGAILQGVAIPGGGASSPALIRFKGETEYRLLAYGRDSKLVCFRLQQNAARVRVQWDSFRGAGNGTGFLASSKAPKATPSARRAETPVAIEKREAVEGVNHVITEALPAHAVVSIQVIAPDGTIQARIVRNDSDAFQVNGDFTAIAPGAYRVSLTLHDPEDSHVLARRRFLYTMAPALGGIRARQAKFETRVEPLRAKLGPRAELLDWAIAQTRASLEFAKARNTEQAFNHLRAEHRYFSALLERVAADAPAGNSVIYQIANPWPELDAVAFLHQPGTAPNRIALSMAGNEYESAAITVSNLQTRAGTFRFEIGAVGSVPSPRVLQLREVPLVESAYPRKPAEDVLPKLAEGQLLRLGPLETRKVWITAHSRDLAAGAHRTTIRIGDLASSEAPIAVPLEIQVARVRLPEKLTYREENWGGIPPDSDPDLQSSTLKDALEHGVNVFNLSQITLRVDRQGQVLSAELQPHDGLINKLRGKAIFLIYGSVGIKWPSGFKPSPELAGKTFAEGIRWYSTHMKRMGLDYADYALYIQDEPGLMGYDKNYENWMALARRIKAADPKMRVYADPAGGAKPEILKPVVGSIDIWQPDLHLVREDPEAMRAVTSSGTYWQYEAPGDQRGLDPLGFNRMKPWVSFQMGMTGGGYWVYSFSNLWFLDPNLTTEYGAVYPDAAGPVTTKRWEASRDGIEDYELLTMLRERATATNSAEGRKLLDEAVAFVTAGQEHVSDISRQLRAYTPDFQRWTAYRARMIEMIERLSK